MLYLLHATLPVGGTGSNSAQHYLGHSPTLLTLEYRLWRHRQGHGACLTQAMMRVPGQRLLLANVWEGTRDDERLLKNRHQLSVLCSLCNPHAPTGAVTAPLPPLHSPAYKLLWPRRVKETGGDLLVTKRMPDATWSRPVPRRESGTW